MTTRRYLILMICRQRKTKSVPFAHFKEKKKVKVPSGQETNRGAFYPPGTSIRKGSNALKQAGKRKKDDPDPLYREKKERDRSPLAPQKEAAAARPFLTLTRVTPPVERREEALPHREKKGGAVHPDVLTRGITASFGYLSTKKK